jgi:hypothetical protein
MDLPGEAQFRILMQHAAVLRDLYNKAYAVVCAWENDSESFLVLEDAVNDLAEALSAVREFEEKHDGKG